MVTEYPRDFNNRPSDAEAIPLPKDDSTPPVIKMNFVFAFVVPVADLAIAVIDRLIQDVHRSTVLEFP